MQNKSVFGVFDKARLKPVPLATESLDMILSNERKTNAPIRLCGCEGWSAPLLFTSPEDKYTDVKLVCKKRIYSIPLSKDRNLSC